MVKTVNGGGYCVITGGGGVGKTHLSKALVAYYRARNQIVRIAAPTALAATLHVGGMTFHDLCKLNIVERDKDEYTSFLDKHPQRLALLRECKVIFLLDEAFATHLQNIKAAIKAFAAHMRDHTRNSGESIRPRRRSAPDTSNRYRRNE